MIKITNLTKSYQGLPVLKETGCTFPQKGLTCLVGSSGCGKSTLLNILAGFDSDYSGSVTIAGTSISGMNAEDLCAYRRNNIGFIFQNYHLLKGYTVMENILLAQELNGSSPEENDRDAQALLNKAGLSHKANAKIETLSGGEKQRAAIVRALLGNPRILLADEPTGALDRKNSTEIMELLKTISAERLVIVITHDLKICSFGDTLIHIEDGKITSETPSMTKDSDAVPPLSMKGAKKTSPLRRGWKNFKVHGKRYLGVGLAIAIGIFAFILSLSFGNSMGQSISAFKEKNTAFNNGYIRLEGKNDELYQLLKADPRVETAYYQYKLENIKLSLDGREETMKEKYPMPKATESMSYGKMPESGKKELALSPSLAKKFGAELNLLIGKTILLTCGNKEYTLTISGIFNGDYDDFFVSRDVEQEFYHNAKSSSLFSLSYDTKGFEDVVSVSRMLDNKKIKSETAANEIKALLHTFHNLKRLFFIVSALILTIGLFISTVLLVKLEHSRYRELGLLSALGYSRSTIKSMILWENLFLSLLAALFNALLIMAAAIAGHLFDLQIMVTFPQILASVLSTGVSIILISVLASHKLLHTEPAAALRK